MANAGWGLRLMIGTPIRQNGRGLAVDPQSSAACSPQFANDRILSATNDFDAGEHSRTSAESAVLLHRLLHDLSAQPFTKASKRVSPLHRAVPGIPSELPTQS
jgi:hypothetical protein